MEALKQPTKGQKVITCAGAMDVSKGQSHVPECETRSHLFPGGNTRPKSISKEMPHVKPESWRSSS